MGYGGYSYEAHQAITNARAGMDASQVFAQTGVHPKMNPLGVKVRESRDSADHPESIAICFALDTSGSMGDIPKLLARSELPKFMKALLDSGIAHPQILFMAFVDAKYDQTPLQVGQFESTADLMDKWLTMTTLHGNGGASYAGPLQGGENYELALYFAARHTAFDSWEKRQRKGYLFMTGDEDSYPAAARETVKNVIGDDLEVDIPLADVMTEVRRTWQPFFLIPDAGRRTIEAYWRGVFGDDVICMNTPEDTTAVCAALVAIGEGVLSSRADIERSMRAGGMPQERVTSALAALDPWLASRGLR
jgi:hypothetical protein